MTPSQRAAIALSLATAIAVPAEGLRQWAYYDPPGILTVCRGHTGPDVVKGKKYSLAECDAFMTADMRAAVNSVERCVPRLPENVLAAFADATYNLGSRIVCDQNNSRAARLLKENRIEDACRELPKWSKARVAGTIVTLPGLLKRRENEMKLCLSSFGLGEQVFSVKPAHQAFFNRLPTYASNPSYLSDSQVAATRADEYVGGSVGSLGSHINPAAVFSSVVPVIVNAVDGKARPVAWPHVRGEVTKFSPLFADGYPPSSISIKYWGIRIIATLAHIYPSPVKRCFSKAVFSDGLQPDLFTRTTAIRSASGAQVRTINITHSPALTSTCPHLNARRASSGELYDCPAAKYRSNLRLYSSHSLILSYSSGQLNTESDMEFFRRST